MQKCEDMKKTFLLYIQAKRSVYFNNNSAIFAVNNDPEAEAIHLDSRYATADARTLQAMQQTIQSNNELQLAQVISKTSFERGHVELSTPQDPVNDYKQSKPDASNNELYRKLQYTPQ